MVSKTRLRYWSAQSNYYLHNELIFLQAIYNKFILYIHFKGKLHFFTQPSLEGVLIAIRIVKGGSEGFELGWSISSIREVVCT